MLKIYHSPLSRSLRVVWLAEEMRVPAFVDRGQDIAPSLVGVEERALGDARCVLGEVFSAADIMVGFGLGMARRLGYVSEATPRTRDHCERLTERPVYQRAAARLPRDPGRRVGRRHPPMDDRTTNSDSFLALDGFPRIIVGGN